MSKPTGATIEYEGQDLFVFVDGIKPTQERRRLALGFP